MFHRFALAYPTLNRLWMDSSQSFLAPRAHITVLFLRRQVGMSVAAEQSLIRFWSENPAFFLIVADLSKECVASLYVTCLFPTYSPCLARFQKCLCSLHFVLWFGGLSRIEDHSGARAQESAAKLSNCKATLRVQAWRGISMLLLESYW